MKWLFQNWERVLFALAGLTLGGYGFLNLEAGDISNSAVIFGLSFFCFFYSNLSRFRRFKGLGFEAELWEDKQKEAAELVERLKGIVGIYSKQILIEKAKVGRWGNANRWRDIWSLYAEISGKHTELGQSIDFAEAKRTLDSYFLFDIIHPFSREIFRKIDVAKGEAHKKIEEKFPKPSRDLEAYNADINLWCSIPHELHELDELFQRVQSRRASAEILEIMTDAKKLLKEYYDVELQFSEEQMERIQQLKQLEEMDSVEISENLISLADAGK